ncbi:MAG TPA: DUF2935 domain-containing protein [Candidatus Thermoplasmatota archaeon]|nr:DUF2935 domain-containing protein [Candidatus Thermoplasmatota archaeon]
MAQRIGTGTGGERTASGLNVVRPTPPTPELAGMVQYARNAAGEVERPYEIPVILPSQEDLDPRKHAWADARFWTNIMSEHALFFAVLMPPELAEEPRSEALEFHERFKGLHERVANSPPPQRGDVRTFTRDIANEIRPFIEYKERQHKAQTTGALRSLVWPLFFEHTRREAVRFVNRLEGFGREEPAFDRREVVAFWSQIMDEHARFVAHLLDPDERELVEKAMSTSRVFASWRPTGAGAAEALVKEPTTVLSSLIQNPEMDAVMSAAQTILDFKTEAARNIEAARIRSIIEPRLGDHVRREAIKFIDELKRTGD